MPQDPPNPNKPWTLPHVSQLAPWDLSEHKRRTGNGDNRLRTPRFAQVRALRLDDILVTGERVADVPRDGYNGSVHVKLQDGPHHFVWLVFPSRCALALLTEEDNPPPHLRRKLRAAKARQPARREQEEARTRRRFAQLSRGASK